MSDPNSWTAGKIVLAIAGGLFLLTTICCVGGYVANKDEIDEGLSFVGEGIAFGQQFAAGIEKFESEFPERFGDDWVWRMDSAGNDEVILLIGVPDGIGDRDVAALQDSAWELWTSSFPEGAMPVVSVGIGTAGEKGGDTEHQGKVHDWRDNTIDVPDLVERTGLEAPPSPRLFEHIEEVKQREREEREAGEDGGGVKIETGPDEDGGVKIEIKAGTSDGE
jgi:hypothetical protein